MKSMLIGLCALTLTAASGAAAAKDCRQYLPREGAYNNTRREAVYDECMKREREREQRRDERRKSRKPIDSSANAPPPDRMVQPLQSK
jgi:hypothetical protein